MSLQNTVKDLNAVYQRLFNHSSAIQGEVRQVQTEFDKRENELAELLRDLERINEAREAEINKSLSVENASRMLTKLQTLRNMLQKIVERGEGSKQTYISDVKASQREEWDIFISEVGEKRRNVDEEYAVKISEVKTHLQQLHDKYRTD